VIAIHSIPPINKFFFSDYNKDSAVNPSFSIKAIDTANISYFPNRFISSVDTIREANEK